jgi:hypothetical protein
MKSRPARYQRSKKSLRLHSIEGLEDGQSRRDTAVQKRNCKVASIGLHDRIPGISAARFAICSFIAYITLSTTAGLHLWLTRGRQPPAVLAQVILCSFQQKLFSIWILSNGVLHSYSSKKQSLLDLAICYHAATSTGQLSAIYPHVAGILLCGFLWG